MPMHHCHVIVHVCIAFLASTTQAANPPFPIFPEAFNTTELFYQPADSTGPPMAKRTTTWDFPKKRGMMRLDNLKTGTFTYELIRCDLPAQTGWVVQGKSDSTDPSTYTCFKHGAKDCQSQKPFWPQPPKTAQYNGTQVINGVTCNRFDFSFTPSGPGGGVPVNSSLWATATAPCRTVHTSQREDFMSFDSTEPAASAFTVPTWLANLDCTPPPPVGVESSFFSW